MIPWRNAPKESRHCKRAKKRKAKETYRNALAQSKHAKKRKAKETQCAKERDEKGGKGSDKAEEKGKGVLMHDRSHTVAPFQTAECVPNTLALFRTLLLCHFESCQQQTLAHCSLIINDKSLVNLVSVCVECSLEMDLGNRLSCPESRDLAEATALSTPFPHPTVPSNAHRSVDSPGVMLL